MNHFFSAQGMGKNARPHLLIARVDVSAYGGISWEVQCPYEGPRECGAIERCYGSDKDVEKWGCTLYPTEPHAPEAYKPGEDLPQELKDAWDAYQQAVDKWREGHLYVENGDYGHRTDQCWFVDRLRSGDEEPEYYLAKITQGIEIRSPLKVLVGHEGSFEEISPLFKLWKESDGDQS